MDFDIDMLGALMQLLSFCGSNCALVVTVNGEGVSEGDANLVEESLDPKCIK